MNNRIKFLLIVLVFLIPFIIAFMIMDDYAEDKEWDTTNYGKLLNPILNIDNIDLETLDNTITNTSHFNGKWNLIYSLKKKCDKACLANIYLLRQVNIALGKDANRLNRTFIPSINTSNDSIKNISINYPDLIIIKNKPDKIHGLINSFSNNNSIFLVDPIGNVILMYEDKFEGKKLLKDIKKLFKLSRIG